MNFTADDLVKKVVGVLTKVPKREFKNYFVRHCAVNKKIHSKEIIGEWYKIRESYKEFQVSFASLIARNEFYQKVFVQLSLVTAIMGNMKPENDKFGLYAGCALFVSEWCGHLSRIFFEQCHPLAFYALWSPFMKTAGVSWEYQGTTDAVLMTLAEDMDEDDAPFALLFPGYAPCWDMDEDGVTKTVGITSWSSKANALDQSQRDLLKVVFGYRGKLHSRQVTYFNPADETFGVLRNASQSWAVDVLPPPQEQVQFEQEEEEDTGAYTEEMDELSQLLKKTAVSVCTEHEPEPTA